MSFVQLQLQRLLRAYQALGGRRFLQHDFRRVLTRRLQAREAPVLLRSPRQQTPWPQAHFRTSTDVFTPPTGPEHDARLMQLLGVYDHNKMGQDNLWATIREEVVKLLDNREIHQTSVDLVRFRWHEQNSDGGRETVTSRVTIWVGVLPDSTTGDAAFESSQDILQLLKQHDIHDIDVAYRESVAQPFTGPELLAPVDDLHPLKNVIDWVTTALSLPIAGLRTLHMQGTLGFYFQVGDDLYGVTARHVLFPADHGNSSYTYVAGPKKEVVLMGNRAFDDFLASIKAKIGNQNNTVTVLEKRAAAYKKKAGAGNEQAATDLVATENDMKNRKKAIEALKAFFVTMKKNWSEVNNRVIGQVVWAPPITGLNAPHGYTKDVCVIKLDKKKFWLNFMGNVIDLGTEIDSGTFMSLMYPGDDAGILTAAQIRQPNNQDLTGDPVRFVIKRGHTTFTTIGRLAGFESHQRRYGLVGTFDSVEAAIYPYDNGSGPFSRRGDSGALIAGPEGEFAALLSSGTGPTDSSDITYGTPMYWLWEDVIKPQFPGANLYFDLPQN
ncbi:hypothetical protein JAAARDRAFT_200650 [Jaapia argillacea MUCL 33604]|uniref:Uncharacterized protein n=1 Tax=Jaapia argillacea MUCL 33604 TaxID=933084 RepID=A0A067P404_9AGAM|nr:hypothetical protein JAAARDRAFT_200650 [Jaapia argillacea MUCL 33604]